MTAAVLAVVLAAVVGLVAGAVLGSALTLSAFGHLYCQLDADAYEALSAVVAHIATGGTSWRGGGDA